MSERTFIQAREVADRLAISRQSFLSRREDLAREHGFPDPMPHSARPLLWRATEVDAWIDMHGRPRAAAPVDTDRFLGANVVLLAEARTA